MTNNQFSSYQPSDPAPLQQPSSEDAAVALLRQKIESLYADEPDPVQEAVVAAEHTRPTSKHQQYMNELQASGKSLTEIQTAWHIYYGGLPDNGKYEVWQEFYSQNGQDSAPAHAQPQVIQPAANPLVLPAQPAANPLVAVQQQPTATPPQFQLEQRAKQRTSRARRRSEQLLNGEAAAKVKEHLLGSVKTAVAASTGRRLSIKQHLHSLAFGLACGAGVIIIVLFSFFNQYVISPFLQPSRKVNDTPVIVNTASVVVNGNKVIIPKINVEIPVDYSQTTTSESAIELALDNGIVHYPTTVKPGQTGNAAFFGHSSNNIFNPGKYKFAFAFLHELEDGDTFYLSNDGTTYAYKVFSKRIVSPKEVGVLQPIAGHTATATLITCDPPGTSINRLVVVGDQISPDPNGNVQPATQTASNGATTTGSALPGNGPSLWSRLTSIF